MYLHFGDGGAGVGEVVEVGIEDSLLSLNDGQVCRIE